MWVTWSLKPFTALNPSPEKLSGLWKTSRMLVAGYNYRESGTERLSRRESSLLGVTLEGLQSPWQTEERGCG